MLSFEFHPHCDILQPRFAAWLFSLNELESLLERPFGQTDRFSYMEWILAAKRWALENMPSAVHTNPKAAGAYIIVSDQKLFTNACWRFAFVQRKLDITDLCGAFPWIFDDAEAA